jgi:hypothetical protein
MSVYGLCTSALQVCTVGSAALQICIIYIPQHIWGKGPVVCKINMGELAVRGSVLCKVTFVPNHRLLIHGMGHFCLRHVEVQVVVPGMQTCWFLPRVGGEVHCQEHLPHDVQ